VLGSPLPRAEERTAAILAPVLASARALALAVKTVTDADEIELRLRQIWPADRVADLLTPLGLDIRQHVLDEWEESGGDPILFPSPSGWLEETVAGVMALFASLRRGALRDLREMQEREREQEQEIPIIVAIGEDPPPELTPATGPITIAGVVAAWSAGGLPTRHGTLESRMQEVAADAVHREGQKLHARQAAATGAPWTWRTQRDNRVRKKHQALEGKKFAFGESTRAKAGRAIRTAAGAGRLTLFLGVIDLRG